MQSNTLLILIAFFGMTTLVCLVLLGLAIANSNDANVRQRTLLIMAGVFAWTGLQGILSFSDFYAANLDAMPPRLVLFGIAPMLVLIIGLFLSAQGQVFIDSLPLNLLTYIHIVRIPVEIALLLLARKGFIPDIMTFEGRNYDIVAGITAPLVAYFGITKGHMNKTMLIGWNLICLALLMNIVVMGVLSAPLPFQQMAFEQPNVAVLIFPFSWLPTVIVPIVLFSHLVSLRQIMKRDL